MISAELKYKLALALTSETAAEELLAVLADLEARLEAAEDAIDAL